MDEYGALRAEILNNSTIIAQVFTISITSVVAFLGFGLQSKSKNWIFFLSVFAVLIPSLTFISSQLESTVRISTYIMTFYENGESASPDTNALFNWENRLYKMRFHDNAAKTSAGSDRPYTFSISDLYLGLGITAVMLSLLLPFRLSDISQK